MRWDTEATCSTSARKVASVAFGARRSGRAIVEVEPDAQVSRAILGLAEPLGAAKREQGVGIIKPLPLVSA